MCGKGTARQDRSTLRLSRSVETSRALVIAKQSQNRTGSAGGIPGAESLYPSSEPSDLLTEAPGLGEEVSKYLKLQDGNAGLVRKMSF